MDHRWGKRSDARIAALVYEQGVPIATGITKNLGRGGVFVEISPEECPRSRALELEFLPDPDLAEKKFRLPVRLPVLVIHRTGDGVGAMFWQLEAEHENTLSTLMSTYAKRY